MALPKGLGFAVATLVCFIALGSASPAMAGDLGHVGALVASAGRPSLAAHPKIRPAAVPADFVLTPSGFMHPSCIEEIAPDEVFGHDLVVRGKDGGVRRSLAPCAYPRYSPKGRVIADAATSPAGSSATSDSSSQPVRTPDWDGWLALFEYRGALPQGVTLSGKWIVPPSPDNEDVTIFFYNDIQTPRSLLQPVLGYDPGGTPGVWNIASWNCCTSGISGTSPGILVNVGDVIEGITAGTDCDSTTACATWTLTTADLTTGQSTVLSSTSPGDAPTVVDPGVLEAYNVTSCDMFPPSGAETFFDNTVTAGDGTVQSYSYAVGTLVGPSADTPTDCGYGGTQSGSDFTLTFSTSPADGGFLSDASPLRDGAVTPEGGAGLGCTFLSQSFLSSCAGCTAISNGCTCVLTCDYCVSVAETLSPSPSLVLPCDGDVSNNNGELACSAGPPDAEACVLLPKDAGAEVDAGGEADAGAFDAGGFDASVVDASPMIPPAKDASAGSGASGGMDAGSSEEEEDAGPVPVIGSSGYCGIARSPARGGSGGALLAGGMIAIALRLRRRAASKRVARR